MRGENRGKTFVVFGKPLTMTEMSFVAGIPMNVMSYRLRSGWDPETAVSTPLRAKSDVKPGAQFGKLTVTAPAPMGAHRKRQWTCSCECGASGIVVRENDMKTGRTTSCGCHKRQRIREARVAAAADLTGLQLGKHGARVLGRANERATRWAGKTHELWRCICACGSTFSAISSTLTLGQVVWCSRTCPVRREAMVSRNKERAQCFQVNGTSMPIAEMAAASGCTAEAIHYRLKRLSMTPEQAIQPSTRARRT